MTETPSKPLEFELCVRRRAEARSHLPDVPEHFKHLTGDFPTVSKEADRLNAAQANSGLKDYFFFPEATPVKWDRLHCDACKRLAAREAADDGLEL